MISILRQHLTSAGARALRYIDQDIYDGEMTQAIRHPFPIFHVRIALLVVTFYGLATAIAQLTAWPWLQLALFGLLASYAIGIIGVIALHTVLHHRYRRDHPAPLDEQTNAKHKEMSP